MSADTELAYRLEGELNEARAELAVRDQQLEDALKLLREYAPPETSQAWHMEECVFDAETAADLDLPDGEWCDPACPYLRVRAFYAGLDVQEAGQ